MTSVLILTSDAGLGHRHAAEALRDALHELDSTTDIHIVNPMQHEGAPRLIQQLEDTYSDRVTDNRDFYEIAYNLTDTDFVTELIRMGMNQALQEALVAILMDTQPDVVVSTYPMYAEPTLSAMDETSQHAPYSIIITDLGDVQSLWYAPKAAMHYAPTPMIAEQARRHAVPDERIRVTGLPVRLEIARIDVNVATVRERLGWPRDELIGLIVGGPRTSGVESIIEALYANTPEAHFAVIAGGDDELYQGLQARDLPAHYYLYNWVDNMPHMMHAADFIITKAGGVIVSEALASDLPVIISEALPGQEVGNAHYVVNNGAGEWPDDVAALAQVVQRWVSGELAAYTAKAQEIGQPRAAYTVARSVQRLAE